MKIQSRRCRIAAAKKTGVTGALIAGGKRDTVINTIDVDWPKPWPVGFERYAIIISAEKFDIGTVYISDFYFKHLLHLGIKKDPPWKR